MTIVQAQQLLLAKSADPLTYDGRGDFVIYQYAVTNGGDVSLPGPIVVSDDKTSVTCPDLSTIGNGDDELQPGETLICNATYFTTQADLDNGSLTNLAQASVGGALSNEDSVTAVACRGTPEPATAPTSVNFLRSYRAFFNSPTRLAVDTDNNVYVTDPVNGRVVVRRPDGRILFELTGLAYPVSIAVDHIGRIYIGEGKSGRVDVFAADGSFSHSLGQGGNEFQLPADIAIDASANHIYVTDSTAGVVKRYATDGSRIQVFGSEIGMKAPTGIALNAARGEVFVVDQRSSRIHVFDTEGAFQFCMGSKLLTGGFFCDGFLCGKDRQFDQGIWVDQQERIFVADAFEGAVYVIGRDGAVVSKISEFGERGGQLRTPTDLVMDSLGRLFVASTNNARVEMFGLDNFGDPETFVPG
ncbi:MAG: NHL repeat-containing protein, partial [Gammaproteobacteria bacterium]|nr:NHL repeat-containing protein [Gammaproteobacteria bacterium]